MIAPRFISLLSIILSVCLSNLVVFVQSTATGDAQYGNMDGYFYVFAANTVYIVDPNITEHIHEDIFSHHRVLHETNSIIKTIADVGPTTWGDSVYIRDQAQLKHYAFVTDSSNNLVWVFDTDLQELVTSIEVGTRPVHIYAVSAYDEIWTHIDGEGSFDVFHTSQVRYRSTSGVIAKTASASHGKLLVNQNLENTGFATNTGEPNIHQISLFSREYLAPINMSLPTSDFTCGGTHGIDYSSVNSYLYVECSNPSTCTTYTSPTACTGSVWTVDTKTLQPVERLISPSLDAVYGGSFGIHGQIYASPEEQFLLVVNKNLGIVSILRPLNNGETEVIDVPISHTPGAVVYAAKDMSETFGINPNPSNYKAVIALEEKSHSSGVVFIDMADVVIAFDAGATSLPTSAVTYLLFGAGSSSRPIERGSKYIMTPIYSIVDTAYTQVAVIDVIEQKVSRIIDIPKVSKLLWVPVDKNELKYKSKKLQTELDTLQTSLSEAQATITDLQSSVYTTDNNENDSDTSDAQSALILGAIAFVLSIISFIAVIILSCTLSRRNSSGGNNHGYMSSEKNSFMAA